MPGPTANSRSSYASYGKTCCGIDRVGVQDNFFELGGHSLAGGAAVRGDRENDGQQTSPRYAVPGADHRATGAVLRDHSASRVQTRCSCRSSPTGSRPPLFLVHGAGGDVLWGYANLAAHMPTDQPIYGIKSRGQVGLEECTRVEEMARLLPRGDSRRSSRTARISWAAIASAAMWLTKWRGSSATARSSGRFGGPAGQCPGQCGLRDRDLVAARIPGAFRAEILCDWLKDFAAAQASGTPGLVLAQAARVGRKARNVNLELSPAIELVDLEEVIDTSHFPEHELKLWQVHLRRHDRPRRRPLSRAGRCCCAPVASRCSARWKRTSAGAGSRRASGPSSFPARTRTSSWNPTSGPWPGTGALAGGGPSGSRAAPAKVQRTQHDAMNPIDPSTRPNPLNQSTTQIMILLKFILRTCRGMMLVTTLTALLSGACNAGLVALVNTALTRAGSTTSVLMWAFVALGLGKLVTNFVSQVVLASFSQGAIAELRRDLIRKILGVPLRHLEEIGAARILVALTDDVFNITQALLAIPLVTVNLAILLGGAAYLGWLSWQILAAVRRPDRPRRHRLPFGHRSAFRCLNLAREEEDKLFGYFRALTEGIKELKLHRDRRARFLRQNIQTTTEIYQRYNVAAETRFVGGADLEPFAVFRA